jgi:aspartate/methionine/tyrosine aminotransferase
MPNRTDISPLLQDLAPSATLAINEVSQARRDQGKPVYRFGLGQSPFPVPEPVVAALQAHASEKDYLPIRGLTSLREVLQHYFLQRTHQRYGLNNILIGPGSKELMFILQIVLNRQLLIPQGSWVSYEPQAILAGRTAQWLPTTAENRWRLTPDTLAAYAQQNAKPSLLVLNYPCNPTGQTYTTDELRALAKVCREQDIIVLSDEIYGELSYNGSYHSIANYYPEGTIVSTGLSKWCGAGGWRLGVFALPEALTEVAEGMAIVASESFTSVSAPTQYAATVAFTLQPDIMHYLTQSRLILKAINEVLCQKLHAASIDVFPAEGGFYVMPDFQNCRATLARSGIISSTQLCHQLLESEGVALLPGTCFGFPDSRLITRLAFVDFDGRALLSTNNPREAHQPDYANHAALAQLWRGIDAICRWVHASTNSEISTPPTETVPTIST